MKVLFLTLGSSAIGGGHVMRCLTLAKALANHLVETRFAVNLKALAAAPELSRSGFRVDIIVRFADVVGIAAEWGGVDAIVCDSYEIDASVEQLLRPVTKSIVVIDDLANRTHDCNLLVDATFGRKEEDYEGLVPPDALVLAGARYALLRPEFAAYRPQALMRRRTILGIGRILVSLGLTDIGGITARVVSGLTAPGRRFSIDVVVGPNAASRPGLEKMALSDQGIALHIDPPDMARLMTEADIAVGAGGTTTWERCCLGLPAVVVILADNQLSIARILSEYGAIRIVEQTEIENSLLNVMNELDESNRLSLMSCAASQVVDGLGVERVLASILMI
jgi:UDP-2,4-diacetamido-2,4,6-trideoxy-beta-L-altropyranose hydrolase